jgi:ligand-binding sensor domain-containing protein
MNFFWRKVLNRPTSADDGRGGARKVNKNLLLAAIIGSLLLATILGSVYYRANRALLSSRQSVEAEQNLRFVERVYVPPADSGFEWVSAPAVFTQAAEFQGHLFIGGPAGLTEFDDRGHPVRDFRVGRELPASPVIRIVATNSPTLSPKTGDKGRAQVSGQPELVIATADAGVLVFNGSQFRQILPESRDVRTITTVLPAASGHLLIGTLKHGLLVYDGRTLRPFHPTLAKVFVTELAGTEADLWIGTQDRGVAHWHGGSVEWFGEAEGMPDARVYAIALAGDKTYVGTPAGIAEFDDGKFARVLAPGAFARALLPRDKTLLAGTMDDGLIEIPLEHSRRSATPNAGSAKLNDVEQLIASGDSVYAVATHGIYARGVTGGWKRVLQPSGGLLTDRNISALAIDHSGRLWVGYFDRGLDIVDANGQRTHHIEDEHVFCVNRVLTDVGQETAPPSREEQARRVGHEMTAVATANGLVLFDASGNERQVLGKKDGLIADHVTDVIPFHDGMAVATPAGLTFLDSGGPRSLYAFQGLVNNHVYTLAAKGHHLLAGTLGGVTTLEDDQVRVSYTTATSALKHNWITAAIPVGDDWWLGTYGAGLVKMDAAGKFESSRDASGELVVNPNAMLATEHLILAGTMGNGLHVMNRATGRWMSITEGLPSRNVTALAAANGFVYVGTDNGLVRIPEARLGQ